MVLVDTTVWSAAFRRQSAQLNASQLEARSTLTALVKSNRAQLLGVVRQELLSGIRERAQYDRLLALLRAFDDIPLVSEDYEQAAAMNNLCRAKGLAGNAVDFLICAASFRRNWPILTLDRDFARYATCLPIKHYSGAENPR